MPLDWHCLLLGACMLSGFVAVHFSDEHLTACLPACLPCSVHRCRGKTVVSNATRWDTFEKMLGEDKLPQSGGWVETV